MGTTGAAPLPSACTELIAVKADWLADTACTADLTAAGIDPNLIADATSTIDGATVAVIQTRLSRRSRRFTSCRSNNHHGHNEPGSDPMNVGLDGGIGPLWRWLYWLTIASGGLVGVLALVWMISRRRRAAVVALVLAPVTAGLFVGYWFESTPRRRTEQLSDYALGFLELPEGVDTLRFPLNNSFMACRDGPDLLQVTRLKLPAQSAEAGERGLGLVPAWVFPEMDHLRAAIEEEGWETTTSLQFISNDGERMVASLGVNASRDDDHIYLGHSGTGIQVKVTRSECLAALDFRTDVASRNTVYIEGSFVDELE